MNLHFFSQHYDDGLMGLLSSCIDSFPFDEISSRFKFYQLVTCKYNFTIRIQFPVYRMNWRQYDNVQPCYVSEN